MKQQQLQVFVLMQFGRKKDWPHGKEIPDYKDEPWLHAVMTMLLVMVTFVPIMLFLVMTLVRGSSSLPTPITVTLLPLDPRQYNTRDRQLVLYRLPICKPLSGALYVTFNSVQIDFVYFILTSTIFHPWNAFTHRTLACTQKHAMI